MLKRNTDICSQAKTIKAERTIYPLPSDDQSRIAPSTLGIPSSRRQVELLSQWLKKITGIAESDTKISESEKTNRIMTAHKFALLEINRQVSVQCLERGNLLKEITDTYFSLVAKYFFIK